MPIDLVLSLLAIVLTIALGLSDRGKAAFFIGGLGFGFVLGISLFPLIDKPFYPNALKSLYPSTENEIIVLNKTWVNIKNDSLMILNDQVKIRSSLHDDILGYVDLLVIIQGDEPIHFRKVTIDHPVEFSFKNTKYLIWLKDIDYSKGAAIKVVKKL